jgi:hypothetical protein
MASLRDFYTRPPEDPKYLDDMVELSNDIEEAIQQVKMTLFTKKGEVLGEPDFGLDLDSYLFEYDVDPFALSSEAMLQVNKYVSESKKRQITVAPSVYPDDKSNRDILVLLVDIPEANGQFALFYD